MQSHQEQSSRHRPMSLARIQCAARALRATAMTLGRQVTRDDREIPSTTTTVLRKMSMITHPQACPSRPSRSINSSTPLKRNSVYSSRRSNGQCSLTGTCLWMSIGTTEYMHVVCVLFEKLSLSSARSRYVSRKKRWWYRRWHINKYRNFRND